MAARHAPDAQPETATKSVRLDRFHRVRGTRWLEPARSAGKRTEQHLIRPDDNETETNTGAHQLPHAAQFAQRFLKICSECGERHDRDCRPRDDDDVHGTAAILDRTRRRLMPEQLAEPALGAIAHDRATDTPRGDDPQPIARESVRLADHRQKLCAHSPTAILHCIELRARVKTNVGPESKGRHASAIAT
jgi:hypothetical protein